MDAATGAARRGSPDEFEQFVRARTPALMRSAYLLTGDQQLAEDLVQEALARTHLAWGRLRDTGDADAYVRKILYHEHASTRHRRRFTPPLPRTGASDRAGDSTVRVALERALRELSPRQRAVIVLRYFEERTETETAELLGLAVGTVKTLAHRGLARLRTAAGELRDLVTNGADR